MNLKQLQKYAVATVFEGSVAAKSYKKKVMLESFLSSLIDDVTLLEAITKGAALLEDNGDKFSPDNSQKEDVQAADNLLDKYSEALYKVNPDGKPDMSFLVDIRDANGKIKDQSMVDIIGAFANNVISPSIDAMLNQNHNPVKRMEYAEEQATKDNKHDVDYFLRQSDTLIKIMETGALEELVQDAVSDLYYALNSPAFDEGKIQEWGEFQGYIQKIFFNSMLKKSREVKNERKSSQASHASNLALDVLDNKDKQNVKGQAIRFKDEVGKGVIYKLVSEYEDNELFKNAITKVVKNNKGENITVSKTASEMENNPKWDYVSIYSGDSQAADATQWSAGQVIKVGGKGYERTSVKYNDELYTLNKDSEQLKDLGPGSYGLSGADNKVPPPEAPELWIKSMSPFEDDLTDSLDVQDEENTLEEIDIDKQNEQITEPVTNERNSPKVLNSAKSDIVVNEQKVMDVAKQLTPAVMSTVSYKNVSKVADLNEEIITDSIFDVIYTMLNDGTGEVKITPQIVIDRIKEYGKSGANRNDFEAFAKNLIKLSRSLLSKLSDSDAINLFSDQ